MNTLFRFYAVVAVFLFTGCGSVTVIAESAGVTLGVRGTPEIADSGFNGYLDFDISRTGYRESIQRVTQPVTLPGWLGVEAHRHYGDPARMIWPDVQRHTRHDPDDGNWHHRRVNTVNPGRTEGAPYGVFHASFPFFTFSAYFKGVVMLDGFLADDGKPITNRLYFQAGGLQGGTIVEERPELGLTYQIDAWGSTHPDNPNPGKATLRITAGAVTHEWTQPGQ